MTANARSQPESRVTTLVFASKDGIEVTASHIRAVLDSNFRERNSSFRGGSYLYSGDYTKPSGEMVIVQHNRGIEMAVEPIPGDAPTLVYIEATRRPDELLALLVNTPLQLVRREGWPRR